MAKPTLNYYETMQVAKVKTDVVQFITITEAIAAITARGAPATDKRWAVYVHPGEYDETVGMVDWVDVIAIGGREETVIFNEETAGGTDDNETVTGANAMIKGFTIVSDGTNKVPRCVENAKDGFEIDDCVLRIDDASGSPIALLTTNSMDIRNSNIDIAVPGVPAASTTAVSLDTDTENYNIDNCKIGGGTNSILLTNCLTLNLTRSTLYNLFVHAAAATGTVVRDSVIEAVDFDGGTLDMHQTYVETIAADTGGTVTAYGGTIRACTSSGTTFVWYLTDDELQVIANMRIADAIAATGAATVHIGPGTYAESNLTLVANVNLVGTDPEQCVISATVANPILNSGVDCSISNLTITNGDATGTAITVTANILTVHTCFINGFGAGDAIAMTGGTLTAYDTHIGVGDIDLSTAPCTLNMYRCYITTDPLDTAGDLAHTINLYHCDFGYQNINSAATGGTIIEIVGCTYIGIVTNAGIANVEIYHSYCFEVQQTNAAGAIFIYGGAVGVCGNSTGVVVWWLDDHRIMVISGMKIAHASSFAAASTTILVGKGTFAENNLAPGNGVDIVGEGMEVSIIETGSTNPIFAIGNNVSVTIRAVKISNTGTGHAIDVSPVADASALILEDCDVVNSGDADCVVVDIGGAGSGTLTARRCEFTGHATNSIIVMSQTAGAGLSYFNSDLCNFTTSGAATKAAIECSSANVVDVNVKRATFSGCARAIYSSGAAHTIDIDESDFTGCDVEIVNNAPTMRLQECYDIGAFAQSIACTVTLLDCQFSDTYTISGVVGVVNAYRTQFATFTNGGTGAISFESCNGGAVTNSSTSAMSIEGGNWGAVTQGVAGGTISMYNTVSGNLTTGAGGTIALYGHCQFSDIAVNAGVLTWAPDATTWRVVKGTADMKIMDAADAAAPGDTILIGPGSFSEALDLDDDTHNLCTFKGFGRDKTTITQAAGNTVLINRITGATVEAGVIFEDLTIELTAGTDGDAALKVDAFTVTASDASVILRNVTIVSTWTAGTVYGILAIDDGTELATVEGYNCEISCTGGATSYAVAADDCDTDTSTIKLYNTILNGLTQDVYNDQIPIELHQCEMNGGGVRVADSVKAEVVAFNKEPFATATPVVFDGAANGVFADLGGCELFTCLATVDLYEWVYIDAANNVLEADADGADTHPSIGVVVWKPGGDTGTTAYVKKHGYLYNPNAPYTAGAVQYLDKTTAGASTETRPTDAVVQILGVAKNTECMLVDVQLTDAGLAGATKWLNIPIAWGAGSAPTGTHVNGNSKRAVAIAIAGQTVYSQAVAIPKDFQAISKIIVSVFPTTGGDFDWTACTSAASHGEAENTHNHTATADGVVVVDDQILDHEITLACNYTMVQGDIFSIEFLVDALDTTTQLLVLGFRLEYIPTK